ncbi:MAG: peptide ABC transporter substrate-binding protein [Dehalococcoidia bacterium]|nr:peptide ABC transporter substrate-binding protein [Dehalococcoidia bacterium]
MKGKLFLIAIILCTFLALLVPSSCGSSASSDGTLNLYGLAPSTLDPALARSEVPLAYVVEIFSGLVSFDPDLKLVPDLAKGWTVSNDGTVYTFRLREGAKFSNGRELTAHDVKYSLERTCDPATGSQTAMTYLGDIVGVSERLSGVADEVSGISVLDDVTLRITIDAPKAYFLSKLAYPAAYVVDRYNVESGNQWWRQPVGTGPFRLEEWKSDTIVLRKNEYYHLEPPRLESVVYKLYGGIPMRMYENGEIDITEVFMGDIERVLDPRSVFNKDLRVVPEFSLFIIGFNSAAPPFDDLNVRLAFSHAIDKDKLVSLVLKNTVVAAAGILPPGIPGYNESMSGLAFDPELARDCLARSRYGDASSLPQVTLTSSGHGIPSSVESALADMWRQNLGVEIEIRQLEPDKYPDLLMGEKDELFIFGWIADYPDPQNFLDILFHSGTADNMGEYSNPEIDLLLQHARVEQNVEARMGLYREIERMLVEDAACLPVYFGKTYRLVKAHVQNLPLTPFWIPRLKHVYVLPH